MKIPCTIKLKDEWRSPIEAWLIGFMPGCEDQYIMLSNQKDPIPPNLGGCGIVILKTFDIGRILELPMRWIKVDYSWFQEEEEEETSHIVSEDDHPL